ncbi:hypothetical protein A6F57_19285 [Alteromonas stellipolaris]|nr:hypothetical protein A6F57_19285 [Alteromonas stellipolaris]
MLTSTSNSLRPQKSQAFVGTAQKGVNKTGIFVYKGIHFVPVLLSRLFIYTVSQVFGLIKNKKELFQNGVLFRG